MKYYLLFIPLLAICLTGCDMVNKINQSTCDINRNSDSVERSTEAINRNIAELENIRQSR